MVDYVSKTMHNVSIYENNVEKHVCLGGKSVRWKQDLVAVLTTSCSAEVLFLKLPRRNDLC